MNDIVLNKKESIERCIKQIRVYIGFRNTLVRQYQDLDIQLMVDVIENHLDDLIDFTNFIVKAFINGPA